MLSFLIGLALCGFSLLVAYLTQLKLLNEIGRPEHHTLQHSWLLWMAIVLFACSLLAFGLGAWQAVVRLGGTALLFWIALQDAKHQQAAKFDFGRSELTNPGLIDFKEKWGAVSLPLNYFRLPAEPQSHRHSDLSVRVAKGLFSRMPSSLLAATGKLIYRHIG